MKIFMLDLPLYIVLKVEDVLSAHIMSVFQGHLPTIIQEQHYLHVIFSFCKQTKEE